MEEVQIVIARGRHSTQPRPAVQPELRMVSPGSGGSQPSGRTANTTGRLLIPLLLFLQLPFFFWGEHGLFLLLSLALIFFSLVTHVWPSLLENDLCLLLSAV